MKYNFFRILLYAVYVYVAICIIQFITRILAVSTLGVPFWIAFIAEIIVSIVAILILAKWYFRMSNVPTSKEGALIGFSSILFMIVCSLSIFFSALLFNVGDGSVIGLLVLVGTPLLIFIQPSALTTIAIMFFGAMYAGYEFDGTYTAANRIQKD